MAPPHDGRTGILFDFNGVIVDDEPQHCDALVATLADHGVPLDRDAYYRDYLGFDDRECFRFTWARLGRPLGDAELAALIEHKAAYYERAIRASMALIPGAAEFVRAAAAAGHRLAVVSGALRREIELVLGEAGLRGHFEAIVAAEDVRACKPDPQGYLAGLAALGLPASRCVAVEDSLPGAAAARAAGLACVMVATSHPRAELERAGAAPGAAPALVWDGLAGRRPDELPWPAVRAA